MGASRKTVLVIEDHPRLRATICKVLSRMGLDVVEASNGHAAMDWLASARPDLVCLDLVLPESSGYELCESIRRSPGLGDLPLLILSERASPADRAHASEVGADAFLAKPFTDDELSAWVEFLLAGAERSRLRMVNGS